MPTLSGRSMTDSSFKDAMQPELYLKIQFIPPSKYASSLYCCAVHLVDSLNITLPTNALTVCHLF